MSAIPAQRLEPTIAAACTGMDPDAFFPVHASEPVDDDVAAACARCPWRRPCLAYALTNPVVGIWAGTNTAQREALRRRHGMHRRPELYRARHDEDRASDQRDEQDAPTITEGVLA